jgi:two-component system, cell cycle sensor histidine kinase and response regulator CckA
VRLVGSHVDITDRKRDELEKARLIQAVEQATDSVVITDTAGTIVYVNPAFEQVTGYTRDEALGKNPRILKSGVHSRQFYQEMWATLLRGEVWRGSMVTRRKDGTLVDEVGAISAIRDATGATISYAAVKRDVTRERKLEKQLLQSQKLESIGRLAGGVAHDFNNLLTVIHGNAAMMLMDVPGGADVKAYAHEIVDATDRAARLTRQLLMFSRQQVMQKEPLDLVQTIERMTEMLTRLIGENILLQTRLELETPRIFADCSMVEQILMNLAVNARDAMPRGGELIVSATKAQFTQADAEQNIECSPGLYACLAVSDTGDGIPDSVLPRIFEPFFTTKEVGKGTGLGLSTVHGIVKQHRGWIDVESKPGAGTTFRVYMPTSRNR